MVLAKDPENRYIKHLKENRKKKLMDALIKQSLYGYITIKQKWTGAKSINRELFNNHKKFNSSERYKILNMYTPNNIAQKMVKQKLRELKVKTEKSQKYFDKLSQ